MNFIVSFLVVISEDSYLERVCKSHTVIEAVGYMTVGHTPSAYRLLKVRANTPSVNQLFTNTQSAFHERKGS